MRKNHRCAIYPKDVMYINGKSERNARREIVKIKKHFGKKTYQYLTISEYCEYTGFSEETVCQILNL